MFPKFIKKYPAWSAAGPLFVFAIATFPVWLAQVWTLVSDRPFAVHMAERGWGWLVITPLYGWFCLALGIAMLGLSLYALKVQPSRRTHADEAKLVIHSAVYGSGPDNDIDVSNVLRSGAGDTLAVAVENTVLCPGRDPIFGTPKRLEVEYSYDGEIARHKVLRPEHSLLMLPEDTWLLHQIQQLTNAMARMKRASPPGHPTETVSNVAARAVSQQGNATAPQPAAPIHQVAARTIVEPQPKGGLLEIRWRPTNKGLHIDVINPNEWVISAFSLVLTGLHLAVFHDNRMSFVETADFYDEGGFLDRQLTGGTTQIFPHDPVTFQFLHGADPSILTFQATANGQLRSWEIKRAGIWKATFKSRDGVTFGRTSDLHFEWLPGGKGPQPWSLIAPTTSAPPPPRRTVG